MDVKIPSLDIGPWSSYPDCGEGLVFDFNEERKDWGCRTLPASYVPVAVDPTFKCPKGTVKVYHHETDVYRCLPRPSRRSVDPAVDEPSVVSAPSGVSSPVRGPAVSGSQQCPAPEDLLPYGVGPRNATATSSETPSRTILWESTPGLPWLVPGHCPEGTHPRRWSGPSHFTVTCAPDMPIHAAKSRELEKLTSRDLDKRHHGNHGCPHGVAPICSFHYAHEQMECVCDPNGKPKFEHDPVVPHPDGIGHPAKCPPGQTSYCTWNLFPKSKCVCKHTVPPTGPTIGNKRGVLHDDHDCGKYGKVSVCGWNGWWDDCECKFLKDLPPLKTQPTQVAESEPLAPPHEKRHDGHVYCPYGSSLQRPVSYTDHSKCIDDVTGADRGHPTDQPQHQSVDN